MTKWPVGGSVHDRPEGVLQNVRDNLGLATAILGSDLGCAIPIGRGIESYALTFQCPPLSDPMRRMRPAAFRLARCDAVHFYRIINHQ